MALFKRRCSIKTKHYSNTEATTAPMRDAAVEYIAEQFLLPRCQKKHHEHNYFIL